MIMTTPFEDMAGRSPKDESPRNSFTIQVCLPKAAHAELRRLAKKEHDGKVSVAARALLAAALSA